eukprot:3777701-Rhodomonas_salina.3
MGNARTILRWNPGVWQAHHSLGMASLSQCDCAQAFRSLSTALALFRAGLLRHLPLRALSMTGAHAADDALAGQNSSPATEAHILHG